MGNSLAFILACCFHSASTHPIRFHLNKSPGLLIKPQPREFESPPHGVGTTWDFEVRLLRIGFEKMGRRLGAENGGSITPGCLSRCHHPRYPSLTRLSAELLNGIVGQSISYTTPRVRSTAVASFPNYGSRAPECPSPPMSSPVPRNTCDWGRTTHLWIWEPIGRCRSPSISIASSVRLSSTRTRTLFTSVCK